jgi:hypothetical protein
MSITLPDFTSLGAAVPQPSGAIPSFNSTDPVIAAQGGLGQGLEKAGKAAETVGAYGDIAKVRMDRATADANLTGQVIQLNEQMKTETDPAKVTALGQQYGAALQDATSAFSDPGAAKMWQAERAHVAAQGQADAQLRNTSIYRDQYVAGTKAQLDNLSQIGATATDPVAFPAALANIDNLTKQGIASGALTNEQAYTVGKGAQRQLIAGRADHLINVGQPEAATALLDQHAGDLDPITQEVIRAKAEAKGVGLRVAGAANRALGMGGTPGGTPALSGSLADRIIGSESGGQNVSNPLSSASGPGQFIDSTWLAMVKSAAPAVAQGKSDAQILALKGDPNLSRQMTAAYAQQNAASLTAQNLPTDDGALYLAHFLGAGGAAKVLSADPSTPMSQLFPPAVLNANPNIANATAGDVRQLTASRVGAAVPTAPQPTSDAAPITNRTGLPMLTQVWQNIQSDPTLRNDQERDAAFNHAEVLYQAQEADASRAVQVQTQLQQATMRQRENAIYADVYSQQPSITAQQIATDPAFDGNPDRRKAMIDLINNPPGSTVPAGQSYNAAQSLIDRMRLPFGNPNKITTRDQVYDQMHSLNRTDLDYTLKKFDELSSPGDHPFPKRLEEFFTGITPQIDKSGVFPGLPNDALGKEKAYEYRQMVEGKVAEYRAQGKNPDDLLNPKKPDYLGAPETIQPFKRTMGQALSDYTKSMDSGSQAQGAFGATNPIDLNAITSLDDMKAAVAKDPALRDRAIATAIQKGWIVPDGAPPPPTGYQPQVPLR